MGKTIYRGEAEMPVIRIHENLFPFDGTTGNVAASGDTTSKPIPLTLDAQNGFISVYVELAATGAPTIAIAYEISLDGDNYLTPTGAVAVVSGFTKASGPGSDGKTIVSVSPPLAQYIRFVVTESGGSVGNLTMHVAMQ